MQPSIQIPAAEFAARVRKLTDYLQSEELSSVVLYVNYYPRELEKADHSAVGAMATAIATNP